jgi:multiple sugar transport system permease protein
MFTIFILFPIAYLVSTSLKRPEEVFLTPIKWIPPHPILDNYLEILRAGKFLIYLSNSFIIASSTTIIVLPIAIFAAYSFSKLLTKFRKLFLYFFLLTQMFPAVLIMVPIYIIFKDLNLINTRFALIIAYTTLSFPFSTLLMKGFFDSISRDLEEAAMVDGCSRIGAIVRVSIPLVAPGLAACGIYSFILAWDEYLYALTLTHSEDMRTLTVGITSYMGEFIFRWELIAASAIIMILPTVILFAYLQKYMVQGLTAGAIKG